MSQHEKIDYVEFPSTNLKATQTFFTKAFGWKFTEYGPDYCDFTNEGINGGFYSSQNTATAESGSALIILYSRNLENTLKKVEEAEGRVNKAIFPFPGGRRFHFIEPGGNELAVWSDKELEA